MVRVGLVAFTHGALGKEDDVCNRNQPLLSSVLGFRKIPALFTCHTKHVADDTSLQKHSEDFLAQQTLSDVN